MSEVRRNEDGTLDEVVGSGDFHLEQLDDGVWWMSLGDVTLTLWTRRFSKHIKATVTEEPRPPEPRDGD